MPAVFTHAVRRTFVRTGKMQRTSDTAKTTLACTACRERKVRCNGANPCGNCLRRSSQCAYPASRRGKGIRNTLNESSSETSVNISQIQVIPYKPPPTNRRANARSGYRPRRAFPMHFISSPGPDHRGSQESPNVTSLVRHCPSASVAGLDPNTLQSSYSGSPSLLPPPLLLQAPQMDSQRSLLLNVEQPDLEGSTRPTQKASWEYHGPWSWMSVCSKAGVRWVCDKTLADDFVEMASDLAVSLSRRMKLKRDQVKPRHSTELDEATAWQYVNAYFENCYDGIFGIVHRPSFEARLRTHFASPQTNQDGEEDAAWYALRNIVYAGGCRCVLGQSSSTTFVEAQEEAFRFFQNALSVFTELTFAYTGLTAVRALTLMSFYAEGIGCPALDYPLCANATQAALAKGLHREPSYSSGLQETEIISRQWLWWTIYCLEKQIAFRSGRPSLIEDDNISTKIPTVPLTGSTMDVDAIRFLIHHAQISAQISSRIMSVKAFKQAPFETVNAMDDIDSQLRTLLGSLPAHLRIACLPKKEFPETIPTIGACYLHCAIHGSLMATHMNLFYPWMSLRFGKDTDSQYRDRIVWSAEAIAQAARQIILLLRAINTDVSTPAWLSFYYPMYAHINLFVYTLQYPNNILAQSDLALLDISAGHFGHLEHITSSTIAFHFPRDSVALASKFVRFTRTEKPTDTAVHERAGLAAYGIETGGANSPVRPSSPATASMDPNPGNVVEVRSPFGAKGVMHDQIGPQDMWCPNFDLDMDVWNFFPICDNDMPFDDFVL